jgi:hypothetical protein
MAVDYRLLQHFEASWYMETALRQAATRVAAGRRRVFDNEYGEVVALTMVAPLVQRWAPLLSLAGDDR